MLFLYIKALHIIFIVTWFSGMFYLCRLFIYHREAQDLPDPNKEILSSQYKIMSGRLLNAITLPSAVLTLIFGIWLLILYKSFPGWLHVKLLFVFLLYLYHISLHVIYNQQKKGIFKYNSNQLRMWNELPTVILVAVVMLVVVKTNISLLYGLGGLILLILVLMTAIRMYKKVRGK